MSVVNISVVFQIPDPRGHEDLNAAVSSLDEEVKEFDDTAPHGVSYCPSGVFWDRIL